MERENGQRKRRRKKKQARGGERGDTFIYTAYHNMIVNH